MKYAYIYPKNWNKIKFNLKKGIIAVYNDELPDFVQSFLNLKNVKSISFENFDTIENQDNVILGSLILKETNKIKDGSMVVDIDYDSMWESWENVEDYKTCWIEAGPTNACSTIQMFKKTLVDEKKLIKNGYNYKIIIWNETLNFLNESQKIFIKNFTANNSNYLVFDDFENEVNYPDRISILDEDVVDNLKDIEKEKSHITQIMNVKCPQCYRRAVINNYFDWDLNSWWSKIAYFSYIPENNIFTYDKCIYDRSDNWDAKGIDENLLLEEANVIICSSKWLYNDTKKKQPNKEVIYIPNGGYDYSSESVEKYEQKTAIYAGRVLDKVDIQKIVDIAKANPEWVVKIYADDCDWIELLADNIKTHEFVGNKEIFKEVEKCHIGLCLLIDNDYVKAQLPDKVFLYGNAGIPCIYSGIADENVEDYNWCIKCTDDLNLDNYLSKEYTFKKRYWGEVCHEIEKVVEKVDNESN